MVRPFLPAAALAGIVLACSAPAAGAGERHVRCFSIDGPRHAAARQGHLALEGRAVFRDRHVRRGYGVPGYDDAFYAPVSVGYGRRLPPRYASTGFGLGSTGYGYGGDFSAAYTTGYDEFQRLGYADGAGTYGGQPYGRGRPAVALRGGYGYGQAGWSPPIQPAGGLAVYSPGAYGPGPRIVAIPTHYTPGTSPFTGANAD